MFKIVALCFCTLILLACNNASVKPGTAPVFYSDVRSVQLLPTSAMQNAIDMPQHLEGYFAKANGDTSFFEGDTWVRANDTILSIHLFSSFGTTIAEISYTDDSVFFESSFMDFEKFKAEYVLADFQICFYPFEALKENFQRYGFEFTETQNENGFERTLFENEKTILKVKKNKNEIVLENELRNYTYRITLGEN